MPQITYWQLTQDTHASLIPHLYPGPPLSQQQVHLLACIILSYCKTPSLSTPRPPCLQHPQRAPIFSCVIPSPSILTIFSSRFPLLLKLLFTSATSLCLLLTPNHTTSISFGTLQVSKLQTLGVPKS